MAAVWPDPTTGVQVNCLTFGDVVGVFVEGVWGVNAVGKLGGRADSRRCCLCDQWEDATAWRDTCECPECIDNNCKIAFMEAKEQKP